MPYVPSKSTYASIRSLWNIFEVPDGADSADMHSGEEEEKQSGGERCHPVLGALWFSWVASLEEGPFQGGAEGGDDRQGSSAASRHDSGFKVASHRFTFHPSLSRCH